MAGAGPRQRESHERGEYAEWSVVPIEPAQFLVALNPKVFQREQARVRERLKSAVDQAFATEL